MGTITLETIVARRQRHRPSSYKKKKNHQTRIFYLLKICFKNKGSIMVSDEGKLKEVIAR